MGKSFGYLQRTHDYWQRFVKKGKLDEDALREAGYREEQLAGIRQVLTENEWLKEDEEPTARSAKKGARAKKSPAAPRRSRGTRKAKSAAKSEEKAAGDEAGGESVKSPAEEAAS